MVLAAPESAAVQGTIEQERFLACATWSNSGFSGSSSELDDPNPEDGVIGGDRRFPPGYFEEGAVVVDAGVYELTKLAKISVIGCRPVVLSSQFGGPSRHLLASLKIENAGGKRHPDPTLFSGF